MLDFPDQASLVVIYGQKMQEGTGNSGSGFA